MPQSPETHDFDRIASDYLREIFPKRWKFKPTRDSDSGRENCQDWVIEIVDDKRELTGVEFTVQNKANPKVKKNFVVLDDFEVDCLIYLMDKVNRPILIHAYDRNNLIGYSMWLAEWEGLSKRNDWQKQKTVTIKIPKKNVLDRVAVDGIAKFATAHHIKHTQIEKASLISRLDPDYAINVTTEADLTGFTVKAKHPNPRPFSINVADAQSFLKLKEALETGQPTTFIGSVVMGGLFDEFFQKLFGEKVQLELHPTLPSEDEIFEFKFLDNEENLLFMSRMVRMKFKQFGTEIVVIEGSDIANHIIYKLKFDSRTKAIEVNFKINYASDNPIQVLHVIELFETINNHSVFVATNLEFPETPIRLEPKDGLLTTDVPISEDEKRLIRSMAVISQKLNKTLKLPDGFYREQVTVVEAIAEGLTKGIANYPIGFEKDVFTIEVNVNNLREFINQVNQGELERVSLPIKAQDFHIFGQTIQLGALFYEFDNLTLLNKKELLSLLNQAQETPIKITIELKVDKFHARTIFEDWQPPS